MTTAAPAANTRKSESAKQRALTTLKFAHSMFVTGTSDFPESKITYQASPHDNHAAWTLGHLATTYCWFTGLIGSTPHKLPEGYDKLFGHGVKPMADAKAYPPPAELTRQCEASYNAFLTAAEALSDAELTDPCIGDTFGFVRDRLDVIEKATWHEGWHSGQISTIRRALGLKSMFGG